MDLHDDGRGGASWRLTGERSDGSWGVARVCEMRDEPGPGCHVLVPVTEKFCERFGIPVEGAFSREGDEPLTKFSAPPVESCLNTHAGVPYVGLSVADDCVDRCLEHHATDSVGRMWYEGDVRLYADATYHATYVERYDSGVPRFGAVDVSGADVLSANGMCAFLDEDDVRMGLGESVQETGPSTLWDETRVPADDLVTGREAPERDLVREPPADRWADVPSSNGGGGFDY